MSVDGTPIKIDMSTSQYGTLEVNGRMYNVHVTSLNMMCVDWGTRRYSFVLNFVGEEAVEPEETWADSYEGI